MNKIRKNVEHVRLRKPKTKLPGRPRVRLSKQKPGLAAAIKRLQRAEIEAHGIFMLALSTDDVDLIARKKRDWVDLIEQLRKVEQSNPDIERANAQTLPVSEVEREAARMCLAFKVALESLPRGLPQRLVGQDEATIQEVLRAGVNDALSQLHSEKWKTHST